MVGRHGGANPSLDVAAAVTRGASAPANEKDERRLQGCEELSWFGVNLRWARRKRGLSIREVHESTGLSHAYLSEVERGLANISLKSMARLARAVSCSVEELLKRKTR